MKVDFLMKAHVHTAMQKLVNAVLVNSTEGKGRTNAIGALMNGLLITVTLFQFNVNADVFHAWMTKDLLPKIPVGTVIVMYNPSFHKRNDIVNSIQQAVCIAEFLPPYSPDLNPIVHTFYSK
jgi:transposase